MNIYETNLYIPLIFAGLYMVLLILPHVRRGQEKQQTRWLFALIIFSIIWEFSIFLTLDIPYPNLAIKTLLICTGIVIALTASYIEWTLPKGLITLVGVTFLATILIDILAPVRVFVLPNGNNAPVTNGALTSYLIWFACSGLILNRTWRAYKNTRFPWHANRLLFWFVVITVMVGGELLHFSNNLIGIIAGQIIRYTGIVGIAYGISSFRIFDVRTRVQRSIAFLIINTISALPLVFSIMLVFWLGVWFEESLADIITAVFIVIIVTLGFFLYDPYRRFVERTAYRYIRGEGFNPSKVVRNYSQAISRTLDVQQLSILIIGTLSELLETNRGALMLVTKTEDGDYEMQPIPAMGQIPRGTVYFDHDNLFISRMTEQHQPILQYDIDFNPDYREIIQADREWLNEMAMELYVPVSDGTEITGLIAIGPKSSGVPYQPAELDLVQILADQTVVALQNARLYSELNTQNERINRLNIDLVDQNERLEIMDQVKSDFITIASHELRTPLTQVKGYADILSAMNEENALTREQTREIVSHINRATLQLESLITAMLDASQLDVDGMQLTFVKTRLDTILRLAVEPLIQAMRERRISLTLNGVDSLPSIHADFKRMVQSFANLLGNAVKYTPDNGHIKVEASLVPSHGDEEFLEIIITDTGIGIDPKFHDLIFEKFFRIGDPQLHSTGSTKFKGAGPGLGLPIAKGVIEAHGGRIWVESDGEDDRRLPGSSFHIVLPVRPPGAEVAVDAETAARPAYLVG